jgi:hypothetical protein
MDAISNADRFVILLRQKLAERAQAKKTASSQGVKSKPPTGHEAIRAVAGRTARAGAEDRSLRRTIIEQLLTQRFGAALVNEARFQQIVDQVSELMASDPGLGDLFADVMAQVKAAEN